MQSSESTNCSALIEKFLNNSETVVKGYKKLTSD